MSSSLDVLLAVMALLVPPAQAPVQAGVVVAGRVVDGATRQPIPDARVQLAPVPSTGAPPPDAVLTVQSSADGGFRFSPVRPGAYTLTVSTVGYIFVARPLTVTARGIDSLIIPLAEGTGTYAETVTVEADPTRLEDPGVVSTSSLGSGMLQELRGVTADDPMRALQSLPGVATGDDFRAEFSMRGAAFRHLGLVIDGTPAPNLLHTVRSSDDAGSIAMINSDVLSRATLSAGPQPRRHGDWLGATLAFDLREGSRDRTGIRAAVSGTSASVVLEGPLGSARRGSWLLSARRSYLDWLIRQLEPDIDSTIGFADGQLKMVYDVTARQQVQLLVLGGDAVYREEESSLANGLVRATSGSTLASASWRYGTASWVLTQRVSFLGADFRNRGVLGQELARGYSQTVSVRTDLVAPAGRWLVEGGVSRSNQRTNQILRRFRVSGPSQVAVRTFRDVSPRFILTSGWVQATRRAGWGSLATGARVSHRTSSSGVVVSPWLLVERRTGGLTWRAGAGVSAHFPDPLSLPVPGESWTPERAADVEVGVEHDGTSTLTWRASVFARRETEGLRPASEDRLDPATGRRIVAEDFPTFRAALRGSTRGFDVLVARRAPSGLSGWVAYTWARTTVRDVTTGERFDGDFDQRHTLNVVAIHRVSYRTTIGAKLRVGSNVPLVGYFEEDEAGLRLSSGRNRVRLPVYVRLDVRVTRTFTFDRRRLTLFLEVMNLLSRENLGQAGGIVRSSRQVTGSTERLVPFVPSAGLLIEF